MTSASPHIRAYGSKSSACQGRNKRRSVSKRMAFMCWLESSYCASKNPSPHPSPKRRGEESVSVSPSPPRGGGWGEGFLGFLLFQLPEAERGGIRFSLPLSASGRGLGGGVSEIPLTS